VKIGLTGGVGSGKSTVARLLSAHGAHIIDADAIAREVVAAGTPGFDAVVGRFGAGIVASDGELDRPALAGLVFADDQARADLNAIVHPLVGQRAHELMTAAPPGSIVVYDVPLLAESGPGHDFEVVVVVEADTTTRLVRLARRGLPEESARARMAAQATDDQRRAIADELLSNDGTEAELATQVDALWTRLLARQRQLPDSPG
jgi:dephospho-CoA kinase